MRRAALPLAAVLLIALYVGCGATSILSPAEVVRDLLRGPGPDTVIVWQIRLPRMCVAGLAGLALGAVGAAFQALLRNPLADPYVVGVSSGAALGGAVTVALGLASLWMIPAGLAGGLATLGLVALLARRRGTLDRERLLLAGVTVSALLSALLSAVLLLAGQDTNRVLGFLLGHTNDADWPRAAALAPFALLGTPLLAAEGRRLNALAMGEGAAARLGVDVRSVTRRLLLVGTAMTAATVGAVGIVGFVGLVAPHLARRTGGVDWRASLPLSAVYGLLLMLAADLLAQRLLPALTGQAGMELNVGIAAALLGAPALLASLRRERTS
jgi:iron complex transport system permease protein